MGCPFFGFKNEKESESFKLEMLKINSTQELFIKKEQILDLTKII